MELINFNQSYSYGHERGMLWIVVIVGCVLPTWKIWNTSVGNRRKWGVEMRWRANVVDITSKQQPLLLRCWSGIRALPRAQSQGKDETESCPCASEQLLPSCRTFASGVWRGGCSLMATDIPWPVTRQITRVVYSSPGHWRWTAMSENVLAKRQE